MKVLYLATNGSEEIEVVVPIDLLRRVKVDVTLASITDERLLYCSRNIVIQADVLLKEIKDPLAFDVLVIPGGAGTKGFCECETVHRLLQHYEESGKWMGLICAAPIVLKHANVCLGKRITSHPSVRKELKEFEYVEEKVVVDGKLITSRGPGTSFDFALMIIKCILGEEAAVLVREPLMY